MNPQPLERTRSRVQDLQDLRALQDLMATSVGVAWGPVADSPLIDM